MELIATGYHSERDSEKPWKRSGCTLACTESKCLGWWEQTVRIITREGCEGCESHSLGCSRFGENMFPSKKKKKHPKRASLRVLYILRGGYKKEGDRLFSKVCCNGARGSGFKLKEKVFGLNIRKFFTVRW